MTAANTDYSWAQSDQKDDASVELNVQLDVAEAVRARDLAVEVKEDDVVVVKHKDAVVLQWRVHDDIEKEVEWRLEDGNRLVLEMTKKDPEAWPCMLRLPVKADDEILLARDALDALLQTELKPLPADGDDVVVVENAIEEKKVDDDDLDAMLDDALDEEPTAEVAVVKADETKEDADEFVDSELKGIAEEHAEMSKVVAGLTADLEAAEPESSESETISKKLAICQKMMEQSQITRLLRTQKSSLETFFKIQQCDVYKGRLNGGGLSAEEEEEYTDEAEKEMNFTTLLQNGVNHLQGGDVAVALHFLRLAAIHHNHSVSICLLHRIYSEMGYAAKAAYFVVKRAACDDIDPATNMLAAEFFDRGLRHFPPLMAPAVHFYQRAAMNGSTHAMLSLAQTFKNGCCNAAMSDDDSKIRKNASQEKFMLWLRKAVDRGAGNAYFVLGCMYMTGDKGVTKSYADAKKYIDKVKAVAPGLISKAPGIFDRLEKLRVEEQGGDDDDLPEVKIAPKAAAPVAAAQPVAVAAKKPAAASSRLAALENQSGGGARSNMESSKPKGMLAKGGGGNTSMKVWETLTKVYLGCYMAYTLAFPLRLIIAPNFFQLLEGVLSMFGSHAAAESAGSMF